MNRQQNALAETLYRFAAVIVLLTCLGLCPPEGCWLLACLHVVSLVVHVVDHDAPMGCLLHLVAAAVWCYVGTLKAKQRRKRQHFHADDDDEDKETSAAARRRSVLLQKQNTPLSFDEPLIPSTMNGMCEEVVENLVTVSVV